MKKISIKDFNGKLQLLCLLLIVMLAVGISSGMSYAIKNDNYLKSRTASRWSAEMEDYRFQQITNLLGKILLEQGHSEWITNLYSTELVRGTVDASLANDQSQMK